MVVYFKRLIDIYTLEGARYAFELLCSELLIVENPGTHPIRPNPGDSGIDSMARLSDSGYIVYQCKFFADQIEDTQKQQIRSSFRQAKKHLEGELKKWILLLPKNLDIDESQWFEDWAKRQKEVTIDYWGEDKLRVLLGKHEHISQRYFETGTTKVLRELVEYQGKILATLREGLERVAPYPELEIGFLRSNNSFVPLLEVPIDTTSQAELMPTVVGAEDIERLVEEFQDFIQVDQIKLLCHQYNRDITQNSDRYDHLARVAHLLKNSSFVIFAVANSGSMPAENVNVTVTFGEGLFAFTEEQREEMSEEIRSPYPQRPRDMLTQMRDSGQSAKPFDFVTRQMRSLADAIAPELHFDFPTRCLNKLSVT